MTLPNFFQLTNYLKIVNWENIMKLTMYLLLLMCITVIKVEAKSDASFPQNWKQWLKVKQTQIPGANVPLPSEMSPLLVDTIKSYSWMNAGKGTKFTIFVNPSALSQYKTHGIYNDGITALLVFEDSGILFVTEHLKGVPIYGTYNFKGKDISDEHPSFSPAYCKKCHVSYQEICRNGTCTIPDTKFMNSRK
jgi:hypothetical protein